jgi:hypothetical protein
MLNELNRGQVPTIYLFGSHGELGNRNPYKEWQ